MKRTKRILQWIVSIVVGVYFAMLLLLNIPFVQRWMAQGVEKILEDITGTEVEIKRLQVDWNGRVIADDLQMRDLKGEEMIRIARMAARLGVNDLIKKRIRIGNAQLYGLYANLYQECEDCDPNFKFLIDAFASKDTTKHTPLDLRINQILIRRGNVKWNQRWKKDVSIFNTAHIELSDLNITAHLNCLTDDSINVRLKRFDVKEKSGFSINNLVFNLIGNKQKATLSDFVLELPNSNIEIPELDSRFNKRDSKWNISEYQGNLKARLSPIDFTMFLPQLAKVKDIINLGFALRGKEDDVDITSLHVLNGNGSIRLRASGQIKNLQQGKDNIYAFANIQELYAENKAVTPYWSNDILNRLNTAHVSGVAEWENQEASGDLDIRTALGTLNIKGRGSLQGKIDANLTSEDFSLGELLEKKELGNVSLNIKGNGIIDKNPILTLTGRIPELEFKGYRYRNIEIPLLKIMKSKVNAKLIADDPNASFNVEGEADLTKHSYLAKADITHFSPHLLNLTKRFSGTTFSGKFYADLTGNKYNKITGVVQLNELAMTDSTGSYHPGDIHLTARTNENGQHLLLISPFLEAQVEGNIELHPFITQIKRMVGNYIPTEKKVDKFVSETNDYAELIKPQKEQSQNIVSPVTTAYEDNSTLNFTIRAYNAEPLHRFLGIPLTLSGTTTANGVLDSKQNALWMNVTSPGIKLGSEDLRNIKLRLESNYESLLANLELQRQMKGRWVNVGMDTQGDNGKLTTRLFFNNNVEGEPSPAKTYAGDLNVESRLWRDNEGYQGFEGIVLPSSLIISDTLWSIHPGMVSYYKDALQIDSFCISQGNRFVRVEGRASKSESDTLHAQLQHINLEYIFSLINFHAVELTGEATGDAYAHSLFSSPKADAYIRIPQFALNYGTMGNLDIHLNWGDHPYSIYLDGDIVDMPHQGHTIVKGYITPKKDVSYHGIDLNVKAERVNMEFINKWTSTIFDNMQGRATGWVHIFGPFKQINIEGDAVVNEGSMGVPFIGVRYHLEGDTVQLRPDNIYFTNAHLYDPQGNPDVAGHQALVTGNLHHDSFKNLTFDILVRGDNILGYDFQDFGEQNFYGTVYATGDVTLQGHPGQVRIGIKAHPERGTTFTYNATSPDRITETPFISYRDRDEERQAMGITNNAQEGTASAFPESTSSDMYIDFDLDIDEQSTMNLLMDARSGDKISLNGSGHMLANYYNKGSFNLFGTYRVNHGIYNMSLQEVIRKNFELSSDGTITFNGDPYDADLNLQAIHTVNSVSLNDINPNASFSNTTTRVNCLMNIGGKARAPRITFDFDIPNANDEEKQMVRALISTEEERNMQTIYLLGIGRFYNYNYANDSQNQGTTAMYSVLSSTLSGTINQALSNMIGSSNWNFGANLRTGEDGWNDMDVEGMVQGNLLNNRLLINGNFGYRDTPVANSNFIGDFDVKYLLTRSGNVALKAYSETNDRYFTKSALTTQGIGFILKKDFTSWRDLISRNKRSSKQKEKK